MNKVIAKEYVDKNFIHKDVIREIVRDITMVGGRPVKNTRKKDVYKAFQKIYDLVDGNSIFWRINR